MKYNFKLISPSEVNTILQSNNSNVEPQVLYENTNPAYDPGMILIKNDENKWIYTTISYLNEKDNFDNIHKTRYGKERNNPADKPNYLPNLKIKESIKEDTIDYGLEASIERSVYTKEFSKTYKALLFYKELLDKDYYASGLYTIGNDSVDVIVENERNFIEPYSHVSVQNAGDLEAYLWIRGVPIRMAEHLTSINSDGTKNYIVEYPDYLLKNYKENYLSVDYIELKNLGSDSVVYRANQYATLISNEHFINSQNKTGYDEVLAPLNLIKKKTIAMIRFWTDGKENILFHSIPIYNIDTIIHLKDIPIPEYDKDKLYFTGWYDPEREKILTLDDTIDFGGILEDIDLYAAFDK